MEKRRTSRIKHRLTCELVVDRQTYPAVVRDLAPTGLFVQTRQRPVPNSVIEVRFPATAGLPGFSIEAGVARHRNVHPRLQAEVQSGVGLEILGRPADYLALASRVVAPNTAADPSATPARKPASQADAQNGVRAADDQAPRSYRVRLAAHGRSHPRTITVQAAGVAAARARALTQAGPGWKITQLEAI
jgi:PilZ domain